MAGEKPIENKRTSRESFANFRTKLAAMINPVPEIEAEESRTNKNSKVTLEILLGEYKNVFNHAANKRDSYLIHKALETIIAIIAGVGGFSVVITLQEQKEYGFYAAIVATVVSLLTYPIDKILRTQEEIMREIDDLRKEATDNPKDDYANDIVVYYDLREKHKKVVDSKNIFTFDHSPLAKRLFTGAFALWVTLGAVAVNAKYEDDIQEFLGKHLPTLSKSKTDSSTNESIARQQIENRQTTLLLRHALNQASGKILCQDQGERKSYQYFPQPQIPEPDEP